MKQILSKLAFSLMAVLLITGCGGSSSSPTETAKKFIKAIAEKDFNGAKAYATKQSGQMLDNLGKTASLFGGGDNMDFGDGEVKMLREEIDGNKAAVYFQTDGGDEEFLNMMQENGDWKVIFTKNEVISRGEEKAKESMPDLSNNLGEVLGNVKGGLDSAMKELGGGLDSALNQLGDGLKKALEGATK
ncbi:MAG: hypothetical protein AAF570_22235 [Bacteroidota bacterium]